MIIHKKVLMCKRNNCVLSKYTFTLICLFITGYACWWDQRTWVCPSVGPEQSDLLTFSPRHTYVTL